MCIALGIQHAMRVSRIIFSSVACLGVPCTSTLSNKRHDFMRSVEHTFYVKLELCVYLSDTTIRWNIYVYLLHKINYMFRPYFHWPSSG